MSSDHALAERLRSAGAAHDTDVLHVELDRDLDAAVAQLSPAVVVVDAVPSFFRSTRVAAALAAVHGDLAVVVAAPAEPASPGPPWFVDRRNRPEELIHDLHIAHRAQVPPPTDRSSARGALTQRSTVDRRE